MSSNKAVFKWDELPGKAPSMDVVLIGVVTFAADLSSLDCPCFYSFSVIKEKSVAC